MKLSRVGPGLSLDWRPDAAESGVVGPVGGTLPSGLRRPQCPRAVNGDIAQDRGPSFGCDVKQMCCLSVVTKEPKALIV